MLPHKYHMHSRFATVSMDGNAVELAPDFQKNGYQGTCYVFRTDAIDHKSKHDIVQNEYQQLLKEKYYLLDDKQPINLPLPEEVIPDDPGSINVRGQLKVEGTQNDHLHYQCTIERLQDGSININGAYERPVTKNEQLAGIRWNSETGMTLVHFGRHYTPERTTRPSNTPERPYESDPNSGF